MTQVFRPHVLPPLSECIHYEADESRKFLEEISAGAVTHETNAEFLRLVKEKGLVPGPWEEFPENVRSSLKWIAEEFIIKRKLAIEGIEEELPVYDELGLELCKAHLDVRFSTPKGEPYIVDWKSGQKRNYGPQIMAYALAAMDKTNWHYCYAGIAYQETGEFYEQKIEYKKAAGIINNLAEAFATKSAPHTINRYCEWCALNRKCPAWVKQANLALVATRTLADYTPLDVEALKNDPTRLEDFLLLYERLKDMIDKEWRLKEALMLHTDTTGYQPTNFTKVTVEPQTTEILSCDSEEFLKKVAKKIGPERTALVITVDVARAKAEWEKLHADTEFPIRVRAEVSEKKGYSYLRRKVK